MFSNAALSSELSAQEGSITQKIRDNLISGPIEEISVLGQQIQHSHTGRPGGTKKSDKNKTLHTWSIQSQPLLGCQNKITKLYNVIQTLYPPEVIPNASALRCN